MVNGTNLTPRSIAGSGAGGGGRIMGDDNGVKTELVEVWGLQKVMKGGLVRRF